MSVLAMCLSARVPVTHGVMSMTKRPASWRERMAEKREASVIVWRCARRGSETAASFRVAHAWFVALAPLCEVETVIRVCAPVCAPDGHSRHV